jgi:hypothetical protein
VTDFGLIEPTPISPNAKVLALSVELIVSGDPPAVAEPVRGTSKEFPSVTNVRVPVLTPEALGPNATVIVQLAPIATFRQL